MFVAPQGMPHFLTGVEEWGLSKIHENPFIESIQAQEGDESDSNSSNSGFKNSKGSNASKGQNNVCHNPFLNEQEYHRDEIIDAPTFKLPEENPNCLVNAMTLTKANFALSSNSSDD